jgi:hypothetical protein
MIATQLEDNCQGKNEDHHYCLLIACRLLLVVHVPGSTAAIIGRPEPI